MIRGGLRGLPILRRSLNRTSLKGLNSKFRNPGLNLPPESLDLLASPEVAVCFVLSFTLCF
jgi:hypothetical protein